MAELPAWRLNLLRGAYLLFAVGLGAMVIWPEILDPAREWERQRGVVVAMLGAFSLLSLLGLVRPLAMLPLLFWELAWKSIWLLRVALPMWRAGTLEGAWAEIAFQCAVTIVVLPLVPWDHVLRAWIRAPAERWRA
jgi:hypothetical protein